MNQTVQPVGQRIAALDIMRGFALCGIIFANLMSFTGFYSLNLTEVELLPWWDRTVLFVIDWLVEGKFYSVFATLLGAGFALQYARFSAKQPSFTGFWCRRMFALMAIGLCHMFFVWHGDILTLYSLLGLSLLLFVRFSNRALSVTIGILLFLPLPIHWLLAATAEHSFWQLLSQLVNQLKHVLGYQDIGLLQLRTSTQADEVFVANVFSALPRPMAYLKTGRPFQVLGQFLLGVYLVRLYLISKTPLPPASAQTIIRLFAVGLVLNLIYAWIKAATGTPFAFDAIGLFQGVVYHLGAMVLALAYMALLYRLCHSKYAAWFNPLAVLGRMSLTMYLIQTSLCVMIFYGYGLGLMGQVPFVFIPVIGSGILLMQYGFGQYWLGRFKQGPMEFVWRRLGYRQCA